MTQRTAPTARRAGPWPRLHAEVLRATLRGLAGRTPTHRKDTP